jgi:hypothetical protein
MTATVTEDAETERGAENDELQESRRKSKVND